jgi:hypothetical protein
MNEMDLLARLRDEAPRGAVSARTEQLFRAGLYKNHRTERRRVRRLVLVAAPALAVATALTLLILPSHGQSQPVRTTLTAKLLADRAAAAASSGPDVKPGQWVYEKIVFRNASTEELWFTADDDTQAAYVDGKLYKEYRDQDMVMPQHGGIPILLGSFTDEPLGYDALGSLPSNTGALIQLLGRLGAQLPGPVLGCAESAVYCDAFQMISQLFGGYVLPPAVAAKLFTAIGDIPGVTAVPDASGANGQHGVAFRLTLKTGYQQLILNPVTYKPTGGPGYNAGLITQQAFVSGPGVRP